jgi:predicted nucleic acid-binding Zn ribbon protein
MVTPLRDILRAAAKAWGIEPAARLAAAREAWPRIVGPSLAGMTVPLAVRGQRLRVGVAHATAAQEVRLRRAAILRALNQEVGGEAVTELVTVARRRIPEAGGRPSGLQR